MGRFAHSADKVGAVAHGRVTRYRTEALFETFRVGFALGAEPVGTSVGLFAHPDANGATCGGCVARTGPNIPRVIDREHVLHVARLARLRLGEEDVERMSGELSSILEHVDRIAELDLDEVEPTDHVVDLENVLRPDEPRPSWPREQMLEQAPDSAESAFRVPSPQAEA